MFTEKHSCGSSVDAEDDLATNSGMLWSGRTAKASLLRKRYSAREFTSDVEVGDEKPTAVGNGATFAVKLIGKLGDSLWYVWYQWASL